MIEDLHTALTKAGEPAPFVIVGHSLGGPYALIYTGMYPAEVAGLVFVDASHPEQFPRLREATGNPMEAPTSMLSAVAALSWTGVMWLISAGAPSKLPLATARAHHAYLPTSFGPAMRELKAIPSTLEAAGKHRQLGDRPLVVLSAMAPNPEAV